MGGFGAVDARYPDIYRRAVDVLGADDRVRSVEVGGSVGEGTADRWSDLDLHVFTDPDGHEDFLGEWPTWLGAITPTVFARRPIVPFIINTVTVDGLTLDVVVLPAGTVLPERPARYTVGMLGGIFPEVGEALEYAVEEQLRGLAGPFISLLERGEHFRHLTGVPHIGGLLSVVFLAETGGAPPGKRWNAAFSAEHLEAVAGLPPVSATRAGVMAFGLEVARLVVTRARPLYPRYGLVWPVELTAVAARRLRTELGVDVSAWLH